METIENDESLTPEAAQATNALMQSFNTGRSRRGLLKVAAIGAGGMAIGASTLLSAAPAFASSLKTTSKTKANTSIANILSIAATAEALAVTMYTHAINNFNALGINDSADRQYFHAAQVEEQIHYNFLTANGGKALTKTFSFPHGPNTFKRQDLFISTLEQLESDFIAAYLAAVKEFAQQGQPGLAQVAAQIMGVEAEHRVLGRDVGGLTPADDLAYEAASLASVSDAVGALSGQGYLSPSGANSFTYSAAPTTYSGVHHLHP